MATVAPAPSVPGWRASRGAASAIARRALRDSRGRTVAFAYLFAAVAYIQPVSYRHTYPTLAERLSFAHSFASNKAVVLFYGKAYDLLTLGGYSAWRVGGILAIFAVRVRPACRGSCAADRGGRRARRARARRHRRAAHRVPRGDRRDRRGGARPVARGVRRLAAGRASRGRIGIPGPRHAVCRARVRRRRVRSRASSRRPAGWRSSSAAPSSRSAFVLRVIADTSSGLSWLRWTTPLGWAEELRPFTGARPAVLLLPVGASLLLIAAAARIAARRDVGSGLLAAHDTAGPVWGCCPRRRRRRSAANGWVWSSGWRASAASRSSSA